MSRGVKFLLKWLLVPSALAAVGYAYVGPRLGGELAEKAARRLQKSGLAEKIPGALNHNSSSGAQSNNEAQPDASRDPETDRTPDRASPASSASSGPAIKVDVARAESRQGSGSSPRRTQRSESASARPNPSAETSRRARAEVKPTSVPTEPQSDPAGIGTGAAPTGTEDPEPGRPSVGGGVPL